MKIGVTVSASIAKETVLSKLINMINVFRIDVANKPFDDLQRKYIDTILKLDDSKTIVLETKWETVTLKNIHSLSYDIGDEISLEYSYIWEESDSSIFVNYPHLAELPIWSSIGFEESEFLADIVYNYDGIIKCTIKKSGIISPNKKLLFFWYKPKLSFLSDKDKKDIIWGIQSWVNLLAASAVKTHDDILDMKSFLHHNNGEWIKIYTRLHNSDMLDDLDHILKVSDGLIIDYEDIARAQGRYTMQSLIALIKSYWKPIMICLSQKDIQDEKELSIYLESYANWGVDLVMIDDDITEHNLPVESVQHITNLLMDAEIKNLTFHQGERFLYSVENEINESNYMVSLLPKIIEDVHAKVIVCYTSGGLTAAKIASLKLSVPSIVFTKSDAVYRYNNLLVGS
jgi:pyruvate kinase